MSLVYDGTLRCDDLVVTSTAALPASSVGDAEIEAGAGILASKCKHNRRFFPLTQVHGSAAATERRPAANVIGTTASVISIRAGVLVQAVGAATVTVDLYKNGSTLLTGVITINSSTVIRTETTGTLTASPTPLVAGDLLEIVAVATAGGGTLPQGLYVQLDMDEDY